MFHLRDAGRLRAMVLPLILSMLASGCSGVSLFGVPLDPANWNKVRYTSSPAGAEIWVSNGSQKIYLGRTPFESSIWFGRMFQRTQIEVLALSADGQQLSQQVIVPPSPRRLHFTFESAPSSTAPQVKQQRPEPILPLPALARKWRKEELLEIPKGPGAGMEFSSVQQMLKRAKQSVVLVQAGNGYGSGFLIREDGLVLTNYHVIRNASVITVRLYDGKEVHADLLRFSLAGDLALLNLPGKGYAPLPLGGGSPAEPGTEVYAIGTPIDMMLSHSISKGIVSASRSAGRHTYLQTDVAVNRGNSGGPLLDQSGRVIGIVTLKAVGEDVEGLAFALSAEDAKRELGLR